MPLGQIAFKLRLLSQPVNKKVKRVTDLSANF